MSTGQGSSVDSFGAKASLDVGGTEYQIYRLDAVTGDGLDVDSLRALDLFPMTHHIECVAVLHPAR